ncbi:MAG: HD domain-containing protein [Gemmatimonadetes bacterium]|nr:HD domain-containing protein [Gemmatimonadota bacterium]
MRFPIPLTLQTKVGRRIALLFVVSALLPVAVLAVEGYRQVRGQLVAQAMAQLAQAAKRVGMELVEQLSGADVTLRGVVGELDRGRWRQQDDVMSDPLIRRVFSSLAIVDPSSPRILWGEPPNMLQLSPEELLRLGGNQSVLAVDSAGAAVWLVAKLAGGGQLWANVDRTFLFRGVSDRARIGDADVQHCVRTASSAILLACPAGPNLDTNLSAQWDVFLGYAFGAAPWQVEVGQPISAALDPIKTFRQTFMLSMVAVLALVVWLSSVQVRRSLQPLTALGDGTRRLAQRDFTGTVSVSSGDEFEELAGSFNSMTLEMDKHFRTMAAVHAIDKSALSAARPEEVAATAASRMRGVLRCASVEVFVAGERPDDGWRCIHASNSAAPAGGTVRLTAADRDRLLKATGLWTNGEVDGPEWFGQPQNGPVSMLPLVSHEELVGVVAMRGAAPAQGDGMHIARQLADQLTVGLSNARLITRLNGLSYGALSALARTVDANSPWTAGHSERVTALSLRLAIRLQLPLEELHTLYRGGLLHDIGKIGVPTYILDLAGPLSSDELTQMRRHPELGAKILAPIAAFADAVPIVLYHHERLDGAGYPAGLKGSNIPYLARLLSVADVYDALVSDRPYRIGVQTALAVEMIVADAGAGFEPAMVDAFVAVMADEGDEARFAQPPRELSELLR